ncbi:MAG: hypothetical protein V6D39_15295 [Dolichospermum lemmermannii FEM_B0920]
MNIVEFISKVIKKISSSVFRLLGRDSLTFVKILPRKDLVELGTKYGGWVIPLGLLISDSVCYFVGWGEDISFDIALIDKI